MGAQSGSTKLEWYPIRLVVQKQVYSAPPDLDLAKTGGVSMHGSVPRVTRHVQLVVGGDEGEREAGDEVHGDLGGEARLAAVAERHGLQRADTKFRVQFFLCARAERRARTEPVDIARTGAAVARRATWRRGARARRDMVEAACGGGWWWSGCKLGSAGRNTLVDPAGDGPMGA